MKHLPLAFLLLATPALAGPCEIVAQGFAPFDNLETLDLGLIGEAKTSIDFAAYVFTDIPVIEALTAAAQRGVRVRIYRDGRAAHQPKLLRDATDRLFAQENVEARFKPSPAPLMHLKAYAIDGALLRTGAGNFTRVGLTRQDNDLVALRCEEAVSAFEKAFNAMWRR